MHTHMGSWIVECGLRKQYMVAILLNNWDYVWKPVAFLFMLCKFPNFGWELRWNKGSYVLTVLKFV